jgi:DhnA family fructose-bisphosphate aldolase class Ia
MTGKDIRLGRLLGNNSNAAIVAVDHGAEFGPIPGVMDLRPALDNLAGADAILMNPTMLDKCGDFFAQPGAPLAIARLTWTTSYCFPWNYKEAYTAQVCSAAKAMEMGADLVMACCTLRSGDEAIDADNVSLFAAIAEEAHDAGIPFIGEFYPLNAEDLPQDELHDQVYRAVRILAELGADAVKTFYTGPKFSEVAESASVPVFVLGASKRTEQAALEMAHEAVQAGARGVAFGRNVFQAEDPAKFLSGLVKVVHKEATPDNAL